MSLYPVIQALQLPDNAIINRRIPKKMLVEQANPTAVGKRQLQEGIEQLIWVSALKPSGIGVPAFRDESREYLEIALLKLELRVGAKADRIMELIHRAIPYPVVLVTGHNGKVSLSLAHKRHSQAEEGQMVMERLEISRSFVPDTLSPLEGAFLHSLALAQQPQRNLFDLYQGWIDCLTALTASEITGIYCKAETPQAAAERHQALDEYAALEKDIIGLRARAQRETQVDRLVALNLEIKRLEGRILDVRKIL